MKNTILANVKEYGYYTIDREGITDPDDLIKHAEYVLSSCIGKPTYYGTDFTIEDFQEFCEIALAS